MLHVVVVVDDDVIVTELNPTFTERRLYKSLANGHALQLFLTFFCTKSSSNFLTISRCQYLICILCSHYH